MNMTNKTHNTMTPIFHKLAAIQAQLKAPKSQFNSFGNYKYRKAEDILEAVKPLLADQGCILTCSDELVNMGDRYYVKATATLTDIETGGQVLCTAYAREEESKKGMDGSQVTGASSSYARKYALNGLLCIDDTQDSDTTNVGDGEQKKTTPKPAAKKTAQAERERWIKAIATHAVNQQGVTAEAAYKAKYNPSPEEWQAVLDEVFNYQLENDIH
jgi:hypothetical protein